MISKTQDLACLCCGGDPATVCDACGQHSCWAGILFCENAGTAGTRQATRAHELAAAEGWAREALERTAPHNLVTLMSEYDRRGEELEQLSIHARALLAAVESPQRAIYINECLDLRKALDALDARRVGPVTEASP